MQNFSPFYRTLPPLGATALLLFEVSKYLSSWATAYHMMPESNWFSFLGSGLKRGQSPVEWGEILFVRTFVYLPPLWLALRPCWLAPRPLQLTLRPCWLALSPLQSALRPLQQALRPLQQAFRPL